MYLLFLFITSSLIQFTASQDLDNDGNDIDNDQDLNINAFGNVITPIKGKKFMKKHYYLHVIAIIVFVLWFCE